MLHTHLHLIPELFGIENHLCLRCRHKVGSICPVGINQNGDEIWYVENGKFEPEANGTLSFEDGDEVTVKNGIVTDGEFTSATGERIRVRNGKILE